MKKFVLALVFVTVLTAALSISCFSAETSEKAYNKVQAAEAVNQQKVLEARFLNMLNHSYVYGDDIYYDEAIVNNSVIALLNLREEDYVAQQYVSDYIYNMYGVRLEDYSNINALWPKEEGYVYIIPRGYSTYNHSIVSVELNEDGSYTVVTQVVVSTHDNGEENELCTTLFVPNEASSFGFNIIRSDFSQNNIEL